MSDGQAELHSVEPLLDLAGTIDQLSASVSRELEETESELLPRLRRLERAQQYAWQMVREAERAVQEAEEDDARRAAEERLERAQEYARRLDDAMDDVRRALAHYKSAATDLSAARRGAFAHAASQLRTIVDHARDYAAIGLGGDAASGLSHASVDAAQSTQPDGGLTAISLPPGFEWVPIENLSADSFVSFDKEPAKGGIERQTIEQGIGAFYGKLVPLLRSNPHLSRDELAKMDKEAGTDWTPSGIHPESLANLGDIFLFGSDTIAAWRDPNGQHKLHSGRHRTTIVRDLGFTHIPAKMERR